MPSVDPSSTTTSCRESTGSSAVSASSIARSIVERSLKTGIRIVSEVGIGAGYPYRQSSSGT